ncbi:MAG: hypothetical protein KGZ75_04000 [Syntrophomonadaceae bacterium]|nr:hypothetical protein [Syntrophomonadaceae bacterium]
MSFGTFFLAALAVTVILTPMFNAARGSILIPVLYHWQLNNPLWPESEQWVTFVLAMAAVVIVLLNRRAMLCRDGAVTEVAR